MASGFHSGGTGGAVIGAEKPCSVDIKTISGETGDTHITLHFSTVSNSISISHIAETKGDTFYLHNNLIYIKKSGGNIVSIDFYKHISGTCNEDIWKGFFGTSVQAVQLNQHEALVGKLGS